MDSVRGEQLPSAQTLFASWLRAGWRRELASEKEFFFQFWKTFFVMDNKRVQAKSKQVNREPLGSVSSKLGGWSTQCFFIAYVDVCSLKEAAAGCV